MQGTCGCQPGKTLCSGVCKDTSSDPAHCGGCAAACATGKACLGGKCLSAACVLFEDDFSSSAKGWTLGTEWAIGPTKISTGQSSLGPDPATDHTASADNGVAGVVLGGNTSQALHDYYYLTSPVVDASSVTGGLELQFYRWLNSDYPPFMQSVVQVYDGGKWVTIWSVTSNTPVEDKAWTLVTLDLTAYVNAKLQVRFGYANTQGGVFAVSGWNIDDLKLIKKGCS